MHTALGPALQQIGFMASVVATLAVAMIIALRCRIGTS